MRAMHPTMAAAKAAAVKVNDLLLAQNDAIERACPGYNSAKDRLSELREQVKAIKAEVAASKDTAEKIKAHFAEQITAAENELAAARVARAEYLASLPKKAAKASE